MWSAPLVGYSEKGEKVNVIVVDSEGIGGLDEDQNHDMRIFSLAVLLSSFFIYNSMGSIDENAVSSLSFVTNLSKHVKVKTSEGTNDSDLFQIAQERMMETADQDLVQYMPKFLWVVRDFTLQLVDDENREIDPSSYLERALQDNVSSGGSETALKNEIKQHLRKYFPDRDCCTMVRPIVDENNLQSLENIGIEDLRSEFVEQAFNLRTRVLQGMKIKHINNQEMDGSTWIEMAEQYIEAINGRTVPTIENSWTYICRSRA